MEPKVTIAINAARLAAKEIHKFSRRRDKINVFEKGPTDFVTQVDSIAENIIIDTLKPLFLIILLKEKNLVVKEIRMQIIIGL